jgi:hypothetical protein
MIDRPNVGRRKGFLMNKRYFGLTGLLGAIVLFVGDMFLYGHFGSAAEFTVAVQAVARNASQTRLLIGGLLGPIGAMLYIPGFWHVHLNTMQNSRSVSRIIFICLTCMMLFGGTFHGLWAVRMLLLKYSPSPAEGADLLIASFNRYLNSVFALSLSIGCIGGILLILIILFNKTGYPRWMVLVNPGLLLLLTPLIKHIPYPFGSIIYGGYINIVFIVFFSCSVIATWEGKNGGIPAS